MLAQSISTLLCFQASTPACARRPLQLRKIQQKSVEENEEKLFSCVADDNHSKAVVIAKELRNQIRMKQPSQVSRGKAYPPSSGIY